MTMPAAGGSYNDRVRASFANPAHAGDLRARYPRQVTGTAAESGSGCRVTLAAGIERQRFREVRFRVFGCPHLVAAAEEWCRQLEGQPAASVARPKIAEIMALLAVPVEKTGRILLLEDAWLALLQEFAGEPMPAHYDQR